MLNSFDPQALDLNHQDVVRRLHGAIEGAELELHYQPIVDLQGLDVYGVEALLRWPQPDGTVMSPAEFVPIAEASGLIRSLGAWTLHEACRQSAAWRRCGIGNIPIAVNLSACQVHQADLVDRIFSTLKATATSPEMIELEITESHLMQDIDHVLPKLRRLTERGIRLAIDDFGTGYSSLSYLKQLPVAKLKIDQSFVRDLRSDSRNVAIVTAIITLAKSLGLSTVAEGVETSQQFELLQSMGCDYCQGYYVSRPADPGALTALLSMPTELDDVMPVRPWLGDSSWMSLMSATA